MEDKSINVGKVAMTMGGNYDPSKAYDKLVCVHYNSRSWVSRKPVSEGIVPSEANSSFWQMISDRGERGPQGQSYVDKELVPIVDDLTTGGSANVLSAEQGKVLKQELTELESKVIRLVGRYGVHPNSGQIKNSEYYYNSSQKKIYRCVDIDNKSFISIPFIDGALYTLNGDVYIWNGIDIVLQTSVQSLNTQNLSCYIIGGATPSFSRTSSTLRITMPTATLWLSDIRKGEAPIYSIATAGESYELSNNASLVFDVADKTLKVVKSEIGEFVLLAKNLFSGIAGLFEPYYYGDEISEFKDSVSEEISEFNKRRNNLFDISFDGYLNAVGEVVNIGTAQEKSSAYISVKEGDIYRYITRCNNREPWAAYATYNDKKGFIERVVNTTSNYAIGGYYYIIYDIVIPSGVSYIRVSYRTYGEDYAYLFLSNNHAANVEFADLDDMYSTMGNVLSEANDNIKSINHRGFNELAPENTLPAFILSKKNGYKYVETDVNFTLDNVPVLLHDSTIDRTSNGSGEIRTMTLQEVKQYDFGSYRGDRWAGVKIPTLEEFCSCCRNLGLQIYLEIKSDVLYSTEQLQTIVKIIRRYGLKKKVTYISFSYDSLQKIRDIDSSARLGLIGSVLSAELITNAASLKTEKNNVFVDVNTGISDELVSLCIDNEVELEVWTINDFSYLLSMNSYITGITSDRIIANDLLNRHETSKIL